MRSVTSGVTQNSVLAPTMYLVNVNGMPEGVSSYVSLFADNAKLLGNVRDEEDCRRCKRKLIQYMSEV